MQLPFDIVFDTDDEASVQSDQCDPCVLEIPSCSDSVEQEVEGHDSVFSCHKYYSDEEVSCSYHFSSFAKCDSDGDSIEDFVFND